MAVIFMDGFDWYTGGASSGTPTGDLAKKWTGITNTITTVTIGPTAARAGLGQGIALGPGNASTIYKSFGTNYTQGLVGFAFYWTSGAGTLASRTLFSILDGTTEQCSIRTNASSVLVVTQAGTVKATGTTVLTSNTWYYIEFKYTINGSTGVAQVKLNGAAEIASTSSLDLTGTANNQWNGVGMVSNGVSSQYYDDIYVLNTATGTNTDFLGPVRIAALYPAAPGNYAQWTANGGSNMGCVSEPYQDGDGSFNQSSTANQIDSFIMDDLPIGTGTVLSVQHTLVARQDAGGPRSIAALNRISSTDYVGTTQSLSTSYQFLTDIFDASPATATAWTVSEVAGLEAGYKLIS